MTYRSRYGLLAAGFIFFCVAAPVLVYFVRGLKHKDLNSDPVQTGLIEIKTDPKDADILLNDKKVGSSPTALRFIEQGIYKLELTKDGFLPWRTSVKVESGRVTSALPGSDQITLIKDFSENKVLDSNVSDFEIGKDTIYYISGSNLITKKIENENSQESINLKDAYRIKQLTSNESFILLESTSGQSYSVFDLSNKKLTSLSKSTLIRNISFLGNDELVYLNGTTLFGKNLTSGIEKQINSTTLSFSVTGNSLYQITNSQGVIKLETSELNANFDQIAQSSFPLSLQPESELKLLTTKNKATFILNGGNLIRFGGEKNPILTNVKNIYLDPTSEEVLAFTGGELYWVKQNSQDLVLLARTSQGFIGAQIRPSIGYFITLATDKLEFNEILNPNSENHYSIPQVMSGAKIQIDEQNQILYLLDEKVLKSFKIRSK